MEEREAMNTMAANAPSNKAKQQKPKKAKNNNGQKKRSVVPAIIASAILISIIVFIVMLDVEKRMLEDYERVTIYKASQDMSKGYLVDTNGLGVQYSQIEIDKDLVPETAITDPAFFAGKMPLYDIEAGTILTTGMFEDVNSVLGGIENPVTISFDANDLYEVVGGTLRPGDRIHIYSVETFGTYNEAYYGTYLLWENVYIVETFDSGGVPIPAGNNGLNAQLINIYLDKDDVSRFYTKLAEGSLRAAKIENPDLTASYTAHLTEADLWHDQQNQLQQGNGSTWTDDGNGGYDWWYDTLEENGVDMGRGGDDGEG